jgi:hypothetical protein
MGCSSLTFREEPLAHVIRSRSGALSDEGSRDPARESSLWIATLGRGSRLRAEPAEKLPAQQWRRLDRKAYP